MKTYTCALAILVAQSNVEIWPSNLGYHKILVPNQELYSRVLPVLPFLTLSCLVLVYYRHALFLLLLMLIFKPPIYTTVVLDLTVQSVQMVMIMIHINQCYVYLSRLHY